MPVGYPAIGGMPMMGGMAQPAPHPMQPYSFVSQASAAAAAAAASAPVAAGKQGPALSSRIVTEPACAVFRSSGPGGAAAEHTAQQIVTADGKVFVECIPGHNVVFAPLGMQPGAAVQHVGGGRVAKARTRPPAPARPSNVFFKYRSVKQRELQEAHPRMNQTQISRMVAEYWRRESEEVKQKFQLEYKEDMRKYELSKKMRRNRPDYEYFEADDAATVRSEPAPYYPQDGASPAVAGSQSLGHEPGFLGFGPPPAAAAADHHGASEHAAQQRHRSFTLPTSLPADGDQHLGISRLIH
ncbi:hypothetical protein H4R18_001350 [Coemansia javaensis]|uniref:HMG box domain-containing protein n=1 Tax=Coemansia javaensis TaxID=2761396 RepID=A0A9W8HKV4_9FUNG|nr:hypothetical protein H4R18_001350 [Coemansia javaensis]